MVFHQFNQFTGRLKQSTNFQPLYPISPVPLQKTESVMIYDSLKTKPSTIIAKAGYCTDKPATLSPQMWKNFKLFQADMSKPVYLAGGKKDKLLFGFTVAYVAVCTLQTMAFVVKEVFMGK